MWGKLRGPHHKIFDFVMGQIGDLLCQSRLTDLLRTTSTRRVLNMGLSRISSKYRALRRGCIGVGPHRKHFRQGKLRGPHRKHFRWGKLRGPRRKSARILCGVDFGVPAESIFGGVNFRCSHHKIFDFVMGKICNLLCQAHSRDRLRTEKYAARPRECAFRVLHLNIVLSGSVG